MKFIVIIIEMIASLIHAPTIEDAHEDSPKFIKEYLADLKIDTVNSFMLSCDYRKDSISQPKYALNTYKLEHGGSASPLQVRMYGKSGELVGGWEQCFGSLRYFALFDSVPIKKIGHLPVNWRLSLKNDLNMLDAPAPEKARLLAESQKADYTIIVFWTGWTGWYSKDALKRVRKYIRKNKKYKFLFIQMNTSTECGKSEVPSCTDKKDKR